MTRRRVPLLLLAARVTSVVILACLCAGNLGLTTEVVCVVAVGFADVRGHVCGVLVSRECGDSVSRGVNGPLGRCCKPAGSCGMVNVRECVQNCLKGMSGEELFARCIEGSVQRKTSGLSLP